MLTVHVRVIDQASAQPVPVRLRISDAAGVSYPPLGRLVDFTTAPGQNVGGQVLLEGDPVIMKVANTWLTLVTGGGPHRRQAGRQPGHAARAGVYQRVPQRARGLPPLRAL